MATTKEGIHEDVQKIMAHHTCIITQMMMMEPVCATDGHTYEREAIETWIAKTGTSPITRDRLFASQLIRNINKETEIRAFLEEHPIVIDNELANYGTPDCHVYFPVKWQRHLIQQIAHSQSEKDVIEAMRKDKRLAVYKLSVPRKPEMTALEIAARYAKGWKIVRAIVLHLIEMELFDTFLNAHAEHFRAIPDGELPYLTAILETEFKKPNMDLSFCEKLCKLGARWRHPQPGTSRPFLHLMARQNPDNLAKLAVHLDDWMDGDPLLVRHDGDTDQTLLHVAAECGHVELCRVLKEQWSERCPHMIHSPDANGQNAAMTALVNGHRTTFDR